MLPQRKYQDLVVPFAHIVAFTRGIAGPEREVVPEQLHDEGGVLVRVLVQGV